MRASFVSVPGARQFSVLFGKSASLHSKYSFHFDSLLRIVGFDLENAFLSLGNLLFREKQCIPIGGIMLCVEAITVCAGLEYEWVASLGDFRHLVSAVRFIAEYQWDSCIFEKSTSYEG